MPLDMAIQNIGEYYAAHYLDTQFPKDIKDCVKQWKGEGSQSAPRRLQALGDRYFRVKTQALEIREPKLRINSAEAELAGWHSDLLQALGYAAHRQYLTLAAEKAAAFPVLADLTRLGQPWLAIAETEFCLPESSLPVDWPPEDPLELDIPMTSSSDGAPCPGASWSRAVSLLFREEESPRWIMLLSGSLIHLFDRNTFAQGRYLRFDLDDAFGRKDASTFEAAAALLAKQTLCPNSDAEDVLHDKLEGQSHKFTHGVSTKLQAAVRGAIEEVCNGWIDHRRASKLSYTRLTDREPELPGGGREITAEHLRREALVFVYRILFCLYAEARGGELGVLPINDDVYRLGYSIEALRDLADAGETPVWAENGSYYYDHLKRLFNLIHKGFEPAIKAATEQPIEPWLPLIPEQLTFFETKSRQLRLDQGGRRVIDNGEARTFIVRPLTATLFDPAATPLLNGATLPNRRLQQIIRSLSLGTDEKGKSIGRINYAELGIVQLGAVYEGLLSFKGFFARENLIQVLKKPKDGKPVFDDNIPGDCQTWFVPESRTGEFHDGEIVLEHRTKKPRVYKSGTFILHLNGVDRVNSASYYTPEVLTRTLVREVLAERLKDFGPERADEILSLTICEPAMGSAAFINEMCDQLAHEYLRLKREQTGLHIEPASYEDELRRVKHYIATRNVYGIDLNLTAVELGALSLWLGSCTGC